MPAVNDKPVLCQQCGREFGSYVYRIVVVDGGNQAVSLVDRDGDQVYDLVKVCKSCSTVYHWHTKEKTIAENSRIYQTAFEQLMSHYVKK